MSSSSKTLLFAAVLTVGVCAASLFRKPPGTTAVAPTSTATTHRLDGPRVVAPAVGEFALTASGASANRPAAPRASLPAEGASHDPPAFPQASPIGGFSLTAPPTWSRDASDDDPSGSVARGGDARYGNASVGSSGGRQLHRVEDGDTLAVLAQRYLGNAARASEIQAANRDALPASGALPIGVDLVIPPSTGVPRGVDRAIAAESASMKSEFDAPRESAATNSQTNASPRGNPAWMSEAAAPPPLSNPVAPGVIRPASERPR